MKHNNLAKLSFLVLSVSLIHDSRADSRLEPSETHDDENLTASNSGRRTADSEGDLRLIENGKVSRKQGLLQIYHDGIWGTVCDDGFTNTNANVVCRQLGFNGGYALGRAAFGVGIGPIWLDEVLCDGTEERLIDCTADPFGEEDCGHDEDVSVICSDEVYSEGKIALVNGPKSSEGRIQIYHDGVWGTVCDDEFSNYAANIVCRELGYSGGYGSSRAAYGQGVDPIWLDNVMCTGSESSILACPNEGWAVEDCGHHEDVGVVCLDETFSEGAVRLVNGTSSQSGRLQIYHDGIWGTVCDDEFSNAAANVVCRQLGYAGGYGSSRAPFGQGVDPTWLDNVACAGDESTLTDCPSDNWGQEDCGHHEDIGLVCQDTTFSEGDIQLVNGTGPHEGRLQVYHDGMWGTVCDDDFTNSAANVVCRQLGYAGGYGSGSCSSSYGQGVDPTWLDQVACAGNEATISDCPSDGWGVEDCGHNEDVGIFCQNEVFTDGDIQLVNGTVPFEGRVQIYHDGIWGTVCDDGFSETPFAADVVCRQLGYQGGFVLSDPKHPFGFGVDPTWLDEVQCSGQETALSQCPSSGWGEEDCSHSEDVGVRCFPRENTKSTFEDGKIILVGEKNENEGLVLVKHQGMFGGICNPGEADADVVCRELGYAGGELYISQFQDQIMTFWIDGLGCSGDEKGISDCPNKNREVTSCAVGISALSVTCYLNDFPNAEKSDALAHWAIYPIWSVGFAIFVALTM